MYGNKIMPGPLPPGQGAPPPQPGGPGGDPQPAQGGGAISQLLMNVDKAIDHLQMVIGQSKATNPQEKQMISQIDQMFGQLMDSLSGKQGADQDDEGPSGDGQGQTVPPEAAGNKGAIPSPM